VDANLAPRSEFTRPAIAASASAHLVSGSAVVSDGLSYFTGVGAIGCLYQPVVFGTRKPGDLPDFLWVNTVLATVKTGLAAIYHAFAFGKHAERYLGTITSRCIRRFRLSTITQRLLGVPAAPGSRPEDSLRQATAPR
jgi:hypothetical protein